VVVYERMGAREEGDHGVGFAGAFPSIDSGGSRHHCACSLVEVVVVVKYPEPLRFLGRVLCGWRGWL
jgi:hypothetical protein